MCVAAHSSIKNILVGVFESIFLFLQATVKRASLVWASGALYLDYEHNQMHGVLWARKLE